MDKISPERRSANMRAIKSKDTKPELIIRKLFREAGYPGYRIHRKDLPGRPDIAYIGRKKAVFVHGCFWHGHDCSVGIRKPKSNQAYWIPKIERNKQRDEVNISALQASGWRVLVIWECELMELELLRQRILKFLDNAA